jgi:Fe-S-cluster-containing hydrogenase component 2
MLEQTGIPTVEDIKTKVPDKERLEEGPVAITECFREIPCDPCYHSCPTNSFFEFEDINDIPHIDYEKCTGCGICISNCPGLAIFVVDYTYSEDRGLVKIPYEFIPLPEEGDIVAGLDRSGNKICEAKVERVQINENMDKTAVIWLVVPKEQVMEVRNLKVGD